jgi:DNA gyrase subunit A
VVNLLPFQPGETISTVVPIRRFEVDQFLIMATKRGIVKKTELTAYSNPRQTGIIAITLDEGDELIRVGVTRGDQDIFLGTRQGMAIRFHESEVRSIGRTGRGVIGIRLEDDDEVIDMEVLNPGLSILTVSESGYGKRTAESEYRSQSRGGKGLINLRLTPKTGTVVGILQVHEEDDVMVLSDQGNLIRLQAADIRRIGRNTQGVRLINLMAEQRLVGVARIEEEGNRSGEDSAEDTSELLSLADDDILSAPDTDSADEGSEPEDEVS